VRCALAFLAVALASLATAVASDFPGFGIERPLVLELQGFFAADRGAAQARGADALVMRVGDDDRWFSAVRARTIGGDQALDGRDVIAMLAPTRPNLIARGARELRDRLASAAVGEPVDVEGLVDRSSHSYLLRIVHVGNEQPPP
jgi:hypothetical protein